jgi:putative membrane protein insertion efficiency factor
MERAMPVEACGAMGSLSARVRLKTVFRDLIVLLIRAYQSAHFLWKPRCRYWPTCSEYARVAVESLEIPRALGLILRRLARCRPWGGHGFDPVPPR